MRFIIHILFCTLFAASYSEDSNFTISNKITEKMNSPGIETTRVMTLERYTTSRVIRIIDVDQEIVGTGYLVRVSSFITASNVFKNNWGQLRIQTQIRLDEIPKTVYHYVENVPCLSLAFFDPPFGFSELPNRPFPYIKNLFVEGTSIGWSRAGTIVKLKARVKRMTKYGYEIIMQKTNPEQIFRPGDVLISFGEVAAIFVGDMRKSRGETLGLYHIPCAKFSQ